MEIKLIATDLDGTLMIARNRVSEFTLSVCQTADALGIPVVLCSSRPLASIPQFLRQQEWCRILVTANGALTVDSEGRTLHRHVMKTADVKDVLAGIEEIPGVHTLTIGDTIYSERGIIPLFRDVRKNPALVKEIQQTRTLCDDVHALLDQTDEVLKLSANFANVKLAREAFFRVLGNYPVAVTSSGPCNIEVTNPMANKGMALCEICQDLQIRPEDVMALGDNQNDLSMLQAAGHPAVLCDGDPELCSRFENTDLPHDQDGAAHWIAQHLSL